MQTPTKLLKIEITPDRNLSIVKIQLGIGMDGTNNPVISATDGPAMSDNSLMRILTYSLDLDA
eukprot:CAMPEP_0195515322 /NCGR_PEP_ID=MMETSP0794_2-20130614/6428_1 /TAXON_ID=515487 /ORGANISM="Stephanopyxis turris, Strain CCMP 815" /LENGTH=62 /DNA_ID=CAMNT_0040643725 /DNA_START=703 /DNA_END=891 /DNA_ORIENTATION=-